MNQWYISLDKKILFIKIVSSWEYYLNVFNLVWEALWYGEPGTIEALWYGEPGTIEEPEQLHQDAEEPEIPTRG